MKLRILALAALMGMATSTASTSAFANEEEGMVASSQDEAAMTSEDPSSARRPPRWNPPRRAGTTCFARNVTGRTFAARGDWRVPPRFVQQRAVQVCRNNSGFFRFSCRALGCRRTWN